MLTAAQRARIRILARSGVAAGNLQPLIVYIQSLLESPDYGIAQLIAGPPERKRLNLGWWHRIRDVF